MSCIEPKQTYNAFQLHSYIWTALILYINSPTTLSISCLEVGEKLSGTGQSFPEKRRLKKKKRIGVQPEGSSSGENNYDHEDNKSKVNKRKEGKGVLSKEKKRKIRNEVIVIEERKRRKTRAVIKDDIDVPLHILEVVAPTSSAPPRAKPSSTHSSSQIPRSFSQTTDSSTVDQSSTKFIPSYCCQDQISPVFRNWDDTVRVRMTQPSDSITNDDLAANEPIEWTVDFVDSSLFSSLQENRCKRTDRMEKNRERPVGKPQPMAKISKGKIYIMLQSFFSHWVH